MSDSFSEPRFVALESAAITAGTSPSRKASRLMAGTQKSSASHAEKGSCTMNLFSVARVPGKRTTGPGQVPAAVAFVVAFLTSVGCTSTPPLPSHTLVTWDEGVCQRVPCTMVRVNGGFGGISCDVAECAPGSFPDGNYRGLSGAPVLDEHGELVGATSRVIGDTGDRVLALVPFRTLHRTLRVALESCRGANAPDASRALPTVEQGQSVAVFDPVPESWSSADESLGLQRNQEMP